MINLNSLLTDIEDIEIGQTVRFNHSDCTAGEDTRRRLYVTRPESKPDSVVGYCHNCQQSGWYGTTKYEQYRDARHAAVKQQTVLDVITRPDTLEEDISLWPSDAIAWILKGKLNQSLCTQYGIAFDTSSHRVYVPRYSEIRDARDERNLMGYQLRKVRQDNSPKYLTVAHKRDKGFTVINPDAIHCVIVEDYISGIRIAQAFPYINMSIIVNWGVKVNIEALYAAAKATHFYVWLDNDNQHVRNQAKVMHRTWKLINKDGKCTIIESLDDPKHHSIETITETIREAF